MKYTRYLYLIFTFLIIVIACKKDEDNSPTGILTGKNWIKTGWTINPPANILGVDYSDFYALMSSCQKDNIYNFEKNGVLIIDEGEIKCVPIDPQLITESFSFDEETMQLTFTESDTTFICTVVEITKSSLVFTYITSFDYGNGLTDYTNTITMIPD